MHLSAHRDVMAASNELAAIGVARTARPGPAAPKRRWPYAIAGAASVLVATRTTLGTRRAPELAAARDEGARARLALRVYNEDYAPAAKPDALDAQAQEPLLSLTLEGDYPPPVSSLYPWRHIAEPHRNTTLRIGGAPPGAVYEWRLESAAGRTLSEDAPAARCFARANGSAAVAAVFTAPGRVHTVIVTARWGDAAAGGGGGGGGGARAATLRAEVACKHVRRELRTLSAADRARYLRAVEAVARTPLAEGAARHGARFRDAAHFTRKHLARMTLDGCTPYHGAASFLTSHAALGAEWEQALQAVEPATAAHYWDLSVDDHLFGAHWAARSPLLSAAWFGGFSDAADGAVEAGALGGGLPLATEPAAPERNSYGRLTDATNNNPSRVLTRTGAVCGLSLAATRLPGCKEVKGALRQRDLEGLHAALEYNYHAPLHMQLGGAARCGVHLGAAAAAHPSWAPRLGALASVLNTLWRSMQLAGKLVCPAACGDGDAFEACACACPSLPDAALANMSLDALNRELRAPGVDLWGMLAAAPVSAAWVGGDADAGYHWAGMSADDNLGLTRLTLAAACHPGALGQFATPLAATDDPLFWPLHAALERPWAFVRRAPEAAGFNHSWPAAGGGGGCDGHGFHDVLPFADALQWDAAAGRQPSNQRLYEYFDPANPELPYVYDSLHWPHCASAAAAANDHGGGDGDGDGDDALKEAAREAADWRANLPSAM